MHSDIIKETLRKRYAKIALSGNYDCCCVPGKCCSDVSPAESVAALGYDSRDLQLIPEASILGVGCGAPVNFADIKEGEIVVDLGSGAGIDVFLSANKVGKNGKVIGIDMTDEMLEKARKNAKEHGYRNVEFRKGDIENHIPVEENGADVVISNCVINLTTSKADAFGQVHRILKPDGRMIISDLVADKEVRPEAIDNEKWCSCIDGALTREHYLQSIEDAGFANVQVLQERPYIDGEQVGGRKITSLVIKAVKS